MEPVTLAGGGHSNAGAIQEKKIGPPSVGSALIQIPALTRCVGLDGLIRPLPTPIILRFYKFPVQMLRKVLSKCYTLQKQMTAASTFCLEASKALQTGPTRDTQRDCLGILSRTAPYVFRFLSHVNSHQIL